VASNEVAFMVSDEVVTAARPVPLIITAGACEGSEVTSEAILAAKGEMRRVKRDEYD
jgi:hypothetical protein